MAQSAADDCSAGLKKQTGVFFASRVLVRTLRLQDQDADFEN